MDLELSDRVVLVTGASAGIGWRIAERFAAEGAQVIATARRGENLQALVDGIQERGGRAHAIPADVTEPAGVHAVFAAIAERHGHVDVVVNNLGSVVAFSGFEATDDTAWQRCFDVNVMSAVRVSRAALPLLRRSTRRRMVFVGSLGARQPTGAWPHYQASKAAMVNLAKSLAMQWAGEGINVNAISPGPVWTESWDREAREVAARQGIGAEAAGRQLVAARAHNVPTGRVGTPDDVAAACLFLASSHADWITGVNLPVDGGMQRGI